jgi:cell division protein FtsL
MFRVFALVLVAIALLGLGRVWMTVRAAESSLHSEELREQIENARYEGDMLEIRRSALASPSRVLAVASATMDMVPAVEVTYLDVSPSSAVSVASRDIAPKTEGAGAVGELVEHVLGMAAGEAQVLLVGDVSLASAR